MSADAAVATKDDYEEVLAAARQTVELVRAADSAGEWFERQKDWAVERWNRAQRALADPDPDLVYLNLGELRGLARVMMDNCDWDAVAPAAAAAHVRFVKILDSVWARLAETGTSAGEQVSAFFPELAAEFPPL